MRDKLIPLIEEFIGQPEDNTAVNEADMEKLNRIIDLLITAKWGEDYPVNYTLTNRQQFQRNSFLPIPYLHKAKTPEELDEMIYYIVTNVGIANENLQTAIKFKHLKKWNDNTMIHLTKLSKNQSKVKHQQ